MRLNRRIFSILILASMLGCGYTAGSLLPSHFKTIYVSSFINNIDISKESSDREGYEVYPQGLESDITKAIINEFIFNGNLAVAEPEAADLVLKGELIDYTKEPLRYDKFDNVEEYRVSLVVNIELKDASADKTMWTENSFRGESTYRTAGTLAKSESSAILDAVKDLAERVVEKTTEGW